MKPARAVAAAVAAVATVVLAGCTGSDAVDPSAGGDFRFHSAQSKGSLIAPADRKKSGNIQGTLLDGAKYSLAAQKGKVVVVNFWGTWCGPCVTETPQFNDVYLDYRNRGVTFVGVDVKEAGKDEPRSFVKDHDIRYPIIYDENGESAIQLGNIPTQGMPFTVLVDKQQRVAAVYVGALAPKDLEPVLNTLAAGS